MEIYFKNSHPGSSVIVSTTMNFFSFTWRQISTITPWGIFTQRDYINLLLRMWVHIFGRVIFKIFKILLWAITKNFTVKTVFFNIQPRFGLGSPGPRERRKIVPLFCFISKFVRYTYQSNSATSNCTRHLEKSKC